MTTVADHIDRASDAVRAANHATSHGRLDGPESYTAVGNLAELVNRLHQLFGYVAASLRDTHAAEHYDDRGRDPSDALASALTAVLNGLCALGPVLDHLDDAHNHLGHIGRVFTKED